MDDQKKNGGSDDDEKKKINDESESQTRRMKNYTKRVCQFCLKEFSSGKALGGHMRIHVFKKQKQNPPAPAPAPPQLNIINTDHYFHYDHERKKKKSADHSREPINCVICDKDFPSWKSLYGHMRCHPGRGWKGINPPSFSSPSPSSSSSSLSSDDDHVVHNDDDVERLLASGVKNRAAAVASVDLTASLKGWAVTAERGRKATTAAATASSCSSSVDFKLLKAVNYLLMMSRGASPVSATKIPEADLTEKMEHKTFLNRVGKCEMESFDKTEHDDDDELNMKKKKKQRKNYKKKVKLSDLESSENATPLTPVAADKYKCDICDKSFSSHQAFGGHRSSHNKVTKIIIINSNEHPSKGPPSSARARGLEFDLNEVPPIQYLEYY